MLSDRLPPITHRLWHQAKARPLTAFLILVTLWMLSGLLIPSGEQEQERAGKEDAPFLIQAKDSRAQTIRRLKVFYGKTEPDRLVRLNAEVDGRVESLLVTEGQRVEAGQPLVALEVDDRGAALRQAEATLRQRQIEFSAAQKLRKSGYMSETTRAEREAQLKAAESQIAKARLDVNQLNVTAPFEGRVEELPVEVGSQVKDKASEVAAVVDLDPLIVRVNVSEFDLAEMREGLIARVRLANGEQRDGEVRYVGRVGSDDLHTFRMEVAIPNPEYTLPAGVSATVEIALEAVAAHFASPAALVLDEESNLGVRSVDAKNTVHFHPVEIVRDSKEGIWLGGLPEELRLITLGAGFVREGQKVRVKLESPPRPAARVQQRSREK